MQTMILHLAAIASSQSKSAAVVQDKIEHLIQTGILSFDGDKPRSPSNTACHVLREASGRVAMNTSFYISNGGDALGPYEMSQLRSMWSAGQITANTLYWQQDGQQWRSIEDLQLGEAPAPAAKTSPATPVTLSSDEKHDLHKRRSNAFVVDLLIGISLLAAFLYVGSLLGASDAGFVVLLGLGCLYFLFSDSLPKGQSVGKRLFGIQTVQLNPHRPCSPSRSVARNMILWGLILGPLIVGSALAAILKAAGIGGIVLGLISVGILAVLFSQYNRTTTNPYGQTLADEWSGTQVIHFK